MHLDSTASQQKKKKKLTRDGEENVRKKAKQS